MAKAKKKSEGIKAAESSRGNRPRRAEWSKDIVRRAIQQFHRSGEPINSNRAQTHHPSLYTAAVRYFGSWRKAIEAAGFDYDSVRIVELKKWNKTKIVQAIRSRKRRHLSLNGSAVEKEDRGLYNAARHHFGIGGWQKALKKAGINPNSLPDPRVIWTKKTIVKEIKQLRRQKVPLHAFHLVKNGYGGLHSSARNIFGTWKKAIEAAGYSYDTVRKVRHNYWNRRRIVAEIRRLARAGVRLNSKGIQQRPGGLFGAALKEFGSWSEAVEAAGFDYRLHCKTWSYKAWLRRLKNR